MGHRDPGIEEKNQVIRADLSFRDCQCVFDALKIETWTGRKQAGGRSIESKSGENGKIECRYPTRDVTDKGRDG